MAEIPLLLAAIYAISIWLAYRWGRHVENPNFWEDGRKAQVAETPNEDPRVQKMPDDGYKMAPTSNNPNRGSENHAASPERGYR